MQSCQSLHCASSRDKLIAFAGSDGLDKPVQLHLSLLTYTNGPG